MTKALTAKHIDKITSPEKRREIPDGLLVELYFVVQPSGMKSWAVRYRLAGLPRKYTIGGWRKIDLTTARELASKSLRAVAEGRDPAMEKKDSRKRLRKLSSKGVLVQNVARDTFINHMYK